MGNLVKKEKFDFKIFEDFEDWCEPLQLVKFTLLKNGTTELLIESEHFRARIINFNTPGKYWEVTDFWSKKLKEHFVKADFEELIETRDYWLNDDMCDVKSLLYGLERQMDEIISNLFKEEE